MLNIINQYHWLISRSLYLDIYLLISVPDISLINKFIFIYNKYLSILGTLIKKNKNNRYKGKSFISDYYFNDEFATGLLQSIYCHNFALKRYLSDSPVVVDIGANIGQFYTFSSHYLNASNVISFEPIKSCFNTLKLNSRHTAINAAIGHSNARQEIFIQDRDIMASLVKPTGPIGGRVSSEIINVVRLDEIKEIIDLRDIDLLKIDTEGYELEILRSSPLTVMKSRFILVECSLNRPSIGGVDEVCKYIVDHWPKIQIVDIFNLGRRNSQIESIEILWKNTNID